MGITFFSPCIIEFWNCFISNCGLDKLLPSDFFSLFQTNYHMFWRTYSPDLQNEAILILNHR